MMLALRYNPGASSAAPHPRWPEVPDVPLMLPWRQSIDFLLTVGPALLSPAHQNQTRVRGVGNQHL
eukprot:216547-Amphidinium_carterae.1